MARGISLFVFNKSAPKKESKVLTFGNTSHQSKNRFFNSAVGTLHWSVIPNQR